MKETVASNFGKRTFPVLSAVQPSIGSQIAISKLGSAEKSLLRVDSAAVDPNLMKRGTGFTAEGASAAAALADCYLSSSAVSHASEKRQDYETFAGRN